MSSTSPLRFVGLGIGGVWFGFDGSVLSVNQLPRSDCKPHFTKGDGALFHGQVLGVIRHLLGESGEVKPIVGISLRWEDGVGRSMLC